MPSHAKSCKHFFPSHLIVSLYKLTVIVQTMDILEEKWHE